MSPRRRVSTRHQIARAASARWRQLRAWLTRERLPRIGIVAVAAVAGSVVLAKVTQGTAVAGLVRALTITVFGLAAITLLAVVIFRGEEVVDDLDATDPMRARDGGALGPRIKRFLRLARSTTRAWLSSVGASIVGLRRDLTRQSVARFAHASVVTLGGVPPADVPPPRSAGHLARLDRAPPPPEPEPTARDRTAAEPTAPRTEPDAERPAPSSPARVRSPRPIRAPGRAGRAYPRAGRTGNARRPTNPGGRSRR
jgi:hypothetical protein